MPLLSDDQIALRLFSIRTHCPGLRISSVEVEAAGQRSDVLVINDALVFRFPRSEAGARALGAEVAILRAVHERVPLPIPVPRYEHTDVGSSPEATFIGYRWLPGRSLRREALLTLDRSSQRKLANQLGSFLAALHAIPLEVLPVDLPIHDGYEHWVAFYARVRASLFPLIRVDVRRVVERYFEVHLAGATGDLTFRPTLRHGDFGPTNILYEPSANAIGGIIDFGSAGPGDPATDIASVLTYGEAFVELLAPSYPGLAALLGRARFYVGTFALQEALWGFEHGDQDALRRGLTQYL